MKEHPTTRELILDQCARYPALRPQDLLKFLHQSAHGCGHFISDEAAARQLLLQEWERPGPSEEIEPLDGEFCRVHLGYLSRSGLSPQTLFRLFVLSAESPASGSGALPLSVLTELAREALLPFSYQEMASAAADWEAAGFPACRHSQEFREAYHPTYRVIRKDFLWLLPLLSAIDRRLKQQERLIAAIEGGSASGKTSLSALLSRIYDCTVFHMDDFFLRPEQRTAQRLAEPGGNVDRERFYEEVLKPLTRGQTVQYQRYDCHSQKLQAPVEIAPKPLTIVEGAYSMHPALADCYDLSVFLRISPELQRQRILKRNGPEAERFFSVWVPLETAYFEAMDPAGRCDLVLEVEE